MKESAPSIDLTVDNSIATITLNIPERHNSLSGDNIALFISHLDTISHSNNVRVLIITGAGQQTFCAGAALDQLSNGQLNGDLFTDLTDKIAAVEIPTVCIFNGNAYGGGTEIGLACDFRVGFSEMKLFVPPARIGLCYPVRGIERFVRILGINTAKRLLVASEDFSGDELIDIGYLTHLAEKDSVHNTGTLLAQRMNGYAPMAVKAMKALCNQSAYGIQDFESAYQTAANCNNSADLKEGLAAMKDKRTPHFHGH
jgi:enoyl-CoA hydratase/carnithine racemase